jgi:hypothetical protein
MDDLNLLKRYSVKILNFLGEFLVYGLGIFVEAVDVQEAEGLDEPVDSADSMFFMIDFCAGLAEEPLVKAELIETKVLDGVLIMIE